jgi:ketosteroid isomerase-like protein
MRIIPGLLPALVVVACAPVPRTGHTPPASPDPAALRQELMEADRTFARITQERGSEGWTSVFLPDARMLLDGGPIVEGTAAIREVMAVLDDPSYSLTWEPLGAEVSASGDLGYTWGRYRRRVGGETEEADVSEGKYVTVWRRDGNGTWKVAADIGNSGAPHPAGNSGAAEPAPPTPD